MNNQPKETPADLQKTRRITPIHSDDTVRTYNPSQSSDAFNSLSDGSQTENSTNMAIIQRISALERKVYNLEQRVYGLQKE